MNDHKKVCNSCAIYIVLFVIALLIIIGITSVFIYFYWYLKRDTSITNINTGTETGNIKQINIKSRYYF